MKKIVLYGVGSIELRRDIEYFLDDGYEIVGYSDTHYRSDVLDGKPFLPPRELCRQELDYIILLSFREDILQNMRRYLISQGVHNEKILEPTAFLHRNAEKYQLDLISDIHEHYQGEQGLIFGLSYSLRGIRTGQLKNSFYDCSWSSLDLYYNFRIFQYMDRCKLLSAVKNALLIFPYYYFDYDMSRYIYIYIL